MSGPCWRPCCRIPRCSTSGMARVPDCSACSPRSGIRSRSTTTLTSRRWRCRRSAGCRTSRRCRGRLSDAAGREMAAEIATDVLIIEDETFIAMDLESLVKNLGHNVIGVARTHSDAVALAKNKKPGLILADIQLADGSSGLDAVNELLRIFEVPVVFITAYPERFLTGERPEPAFLISKPFQPAMVSAVASQALFFQRNSRNRPSRAAAS